MKFRGFTLIELLIVIAVLGILISYAVPFLTGARSTGPSQVFVPQVQPTAVPQCINGFLMRGSDGVTTADGKIVKC